MPGATEARHGYAEGLDGLPSEAILSVIQDTQLRAAEAVRGIADQLGAKPGQVALAWVLHKGEDIVPIPGTKRRRYLEENIAAADLALDGDQMRALDAALAPGKVAGPRYNPQTMSMVDR